jgi:uncharacterized repeat protein (TIGR03843 family)
VSEPKPALQIEVPEPPADPAAVSSLLSCGDIEVKGRMPWSSNATFLVEVCGAPGRCFAIYKPERGERPLWDFPPGLWRREVAAHRLAAALGWDFVPLTVPRSDAPLGEGSLQQFVSFDPDAHYFTLYEDEATHDQLRRFAVFDLLINNTDRKSGHLLRDAAGRIWGIDHGLAFHHESKLRTVIWEFGGEVMRADEVEPVARLVRRGLPVEVSVLLDPFERDAVLTRARAVVAEARFPVDGTGRRYPWPLV